MESCRTASSKRFGYRICWPYRQQDDGYRRVVLETGLAQPEAIALYESEGYGPIDGFGHYKDAPLSLSFAKDLDGDT